MRQLFQFFQCSIRQAKNRLHSVFQEQETL
jgi:hypothetical protein